MAVDLCKPDDPEAKGMVERDNGYLETSFLPGRSFTSPGDFTAQMSRGLRPCRTVAITGRWGVARSNGGRPTGRRCWRCPRCSGDRVAVLGAPAAGLLRPPRLQRLLGASLGDRPPGRGVADLDRVVVTCGGRVVADHARCWADHQTITDPDHAAARQRCARPGPRPPARRSPMRSSSAL